MKRFLLLITMAAWFGFSGLCSAAFIKNEDKEVHQIKGRVSGKDWIYVET